LEIQSLLIQYLARDKGSHDLGHRIFIAEGGNM
jgi:hypothetical protein